ncbi:MAG: hypothetical protein DRZ82_07775 [Thermoprotei archaeon]|nr:MAG: hypothetical protein DRZ82_07775 [Thermoprotei archaeon]
MVNLYIMRYVVEQIEREARSNYPYEICGVMLGKYFSDGLLVLKAYPMTGMKRERWTFEIDVREWIRIINEGRKEGYIYIGLYHSHPDAHPIPSNTDIHRMLECPGEIWLIVSVYRDRPMEMAAYTMPSASSALLRVNLEVVDKEIMKSEIGVNSDFSFSFGEQFP